MSWSIHHGDFTETEFLKGQIHLITGMTRGIGQALLGISLGGRHGIDAGPR